MKRERAGKFYLTIVTLAILLCGVLILAVGAGAVRIAPVSIVKVILHFFGINFKRNPEQKIISIIMYVRMPRVVTAMFVGFSLAAAGAAMQGLFRNPMASPDVLGVSAGGSLGAVIAIHSGIAFLNLYFFPVMAMAGSMLAAFLVYALASYRGHTSLLFVIIGGMAVSSFINGLISTVLLFSKQWEVSQFIFWTMGGLGGRRWEQLFMILPLLLPALGLLFFFSRDLNLIMLGEEQAVASGMNVQFVKKMILILSAIVTGLSVSVSGTIGFVGLLIPHFFRLIVGDDYRVLLPVSALGGAIFLVLCDLLGRVILAPFEIRVGIVTSLIGAPYLIFLIFRYQRKGLVETL